MLTSSSVEVPTLEISLGSIVSCEGSIWSVYCYKAKLEELAVNWTRLAASTRSTGCWLNSHLVEVLKSVNMAPSRVPT